MMELSSNKKCARYKLKVGTTLITMLSLQCSATAHGETIGTGTNSVDLTLQSKKTGFEVVKSTLNKIHGSQIFPEDYGFLLRAAMVESGYGLGLVETQNFTGGIWRVDKEKYELTKTLSKHPFHDKLTEARNKIQRYFSINWTDTTMDDLTKPFHSALAFRLFFHLVQYQNSTSIQELLSHSQNQSQEEQDQGRYSHEYQEAQLAIPDTLENQASHWARYYHDNKNQLSEDDFIYILENLESKEGTCGGKMDLVLVLDGSASVGSEMFEKAKEFVTNLFLSYTQPQKTEIENTNPVPVRLGFIVFSSRAFTMFTLTNKLSYEDMKEVVKRTNYPGQGSNINSGIAEALHLFTDPHLSYSETDRTGAPKVMVVVTDGTSDTPAENSIPAIIETKKLNIITFAISLGESEQSKLLEIAYNQSSHVSSLTEYSKLREFYRKLNSLTCTVPQTPAQSFDNETKKTTTITTDSVSKKETRLYRFTLPDSGEGLTVYLTSSQGQVQGFYLYGLDVIPSSVLHDGALVGDGSGTFISSINSTQTQSKHFSSIDLPNSKKKIVEKEREKSKNRRIDEIQTRMHNMWFDEINHDELSHSKNYKYKTAVMNNYYSNDIKDSESFLRRNTVLITIQGLQNVNNYTMRTISGFVRPLSGKYNNRARGFTDFRETRISVLLVLLLHFLTIQCFLI